MDKLPNGRIMAVQGPGKLLSKALSLMWLSVSNYLLTHFCFTHFPTQASESWEGASDWPSGLSQHARGPCVHRPSFWEGRVQQPPVCMAHLATNKAVPGSVLGLLE